MPKWPVVGHRQKAACATPRVVLARRCVVSLFFAQANGTHCRTLLSALRWRRRALPISAGAGQWQDLACPASPYAAITLCCRGVAHAELYVGPDVLPRLARTIINHAPRTAGGCML